MRIVFASHSPFDEFLVVGSHHLARELSSAGHEVLHIGPPITPLHFLLMNRGPYWRRVVTALSGPKQIQTRLTSMDPVSLVPWQLARHGLAAENRFVQYSNIALLLRDLRKMGEVDYLLIDDPRMVGIERIVKPRALFYRPTDLYADLKTDPSITRAEQLLLSRCDGVIATSQLVLQHVLSLRPGVRSLLLTNGVDTKHFSHPFAEPDDLKSIPHPRAVYVGALDDRFDVPLMGHLADALPGVHYIAIGPGTNLQKLASLGKPNIHCLGPRPYQHIPGYLQHCDLALLPLTNQVANAGRSPMKLYEYAAAGLPVVSLATDEIRRRQEEFVYLFSNETEAVSQIRRVLEEWTDKEAIARLSAPHSWTSKTEELLSFLRGPSSSREALATCDAGFASRPCPLPPDSAAAQMN